MMYGVEATKSPEGFYLDKRLTFIGVINGHFYNLVLENFLFSCRPHTFWCTERERELGG